MLVLAVSNGVFLGAAGVFLVIAAVFVSLDEAGCAVGAFLIAAVLLGIGLLAGEALFG